jgi:hypothetical protein
MKPHDKTIHPTIVSAPDREDVTPMSARLHERLNHRTLAMLRAVDEGRAELTCSREPDLFIDGVACCDQFNAHLLAHDGLIRPARDGHLGQRVPAILTSDGLAAIAPAPAAA